MISWLVSGAGSLFVGLLAYLYRRYRMLPTREGSSFLSFLIGTLTFQVGRFLQRFVASQLAAKTYARTCLRRTPTIMQIPTETGKNFALKIRQSYIPAVLLENESERVSDETLITGTRSSGGPSLIVGEPGCGKTTLMIKLFRDACNACLESPRARPLPIHFDLRELKWSDGDEHIFEPGRWLLSLARERVLETTSVYRGDYVFDAYLNSSGIVVFLDGLDEVPSNYLARASDEIIGLHRKLVNASFGANAVIVTGRHQVLSVLSREFKDAVAQTLFIQPFTLADIYAFLRAWPFDSKNISAESSRIFKTIRSTPSLQDMCSNPLVLSMYVLRDQRGQDAKMLGRNVRLPDNRTEFYKIVVEELLVLRREGQSKFATVGVDLKVQREEILGRSALSHLLDHEQPRNSLSWKQVVNTAIPILGDVGRSEAAQYLKQLALDTGLFSEARPNETIQFMHLTICEYLAAKELSERDQDEVDAILGRAITGEHFVTGHRLYEVATFTSALTTRTHRRTLVRRFAESSVTWSLALKIMSERHDYDIDLLEEMVDQSLVTAHTSGFDAESTRLLLSCLVRSEVQRATGSREAVPAVSYVRSLVQILPKSDEHAVYDVYLQIDPTRAMSMLLSQGDDAGLSVGAISRSLQDPAMTDFVIRSACSSSTQQEANYWCLALAEAALSYGLVAEILMSSPQQHELDRWVTTGTDGAQFGWDRIGPVANTLYGQTLAIATQSEQSFDRADQNDCPRVGILASIGVYQILGSGPNDNAMKEILNLMRHRGLPSSYVGASALRRKDGDYELWMPRSEAQMGLVLNPEQLYFGRRRIIAGDDIVASQTRLRGRSQAVVATAAA